MNESTTSNRSVWKGELGRGTLVLAGLWIAWLLIFGTSVVVTWNSYTAPKPGQPASSTAKLCTAFSFSHQYEPCTFWHYYFFDPYAANSGFLLTLELLGIGNIGFMVVRGIVYHTTRSHI